MPALRRTTALLTLALVTLSLAPLAAAEDGLLTEGCGVTPGGWGAPPAGDNPGALLHARFDDVFGDELVVGPYVFESAQNITDALPATGGDPLFNHAVALTLNLYFGHEGLLDGSLVGTVVVGGEFDGFTAEEMLFIAVMALYLQEELTSEEISSVVDALSGLNEESYGCFDGELPPCEDDMETEVDECAEEPPCVDDMQTEVDECGETEIPFFPGFTSLALGSLGALAVVGMMFRRRS